MPGRNRRAQVNKLKEEDRNNPDVVKKLVLDEIKQVYQQNYHFIRKGRRG